MKIQQLDLLAFGPFLNQTLDFHQGQFGLHLVYGSNEAGKSSTLRAIQHALYGIPMQTPDNFRVAYGNFRIGATLEDHHGEVFSFIRRKGSKGTLRSLDDQVLPDDVLDLFLGNVEQSRFKMQFGLDWEQLRKGGDEMIHSQGELGHILFGVAAGLPPISEVQESLKKEMEELYKPAGKLPTLNQVLEHYQALEQQIQTSRFSSGEWLRHEESRKEAEQLSEDLQSQKKTLDQAWNRLKRIQHAKPAIQKYRECARELAKFQEVVLLPEGFSERRQNAADQFVRANESQKLLVGQLSRLEDQTATITVEEAVLLQEQEIEALNQQIEKYNSSKTDYPGINSKREVAEAEARQLMKSLRADALWEEVENLRLGDADRAAIRNLGPEQKAIQVRLKSTREDLRDSETQLAELQAEQAGLAEVPDLSALKLAVKQAAECGPLEAELASKQQQLELAESQVKKECARLPFWSGTPTELESLTVPLRETVKQFQTRLEEAEKILEKHQLDLQREQSSLKENRERFEQLELEGEVPTEEALATSRQHREQGWQLILQCWQNAEDPQETLEQFLSESEEPDLGEAYEKAVAQADAISDQLRQQANQVTLKKQLLAEQKKLQAKLPRIADRIAECVQNREGILSDWHRLWEPVNISPGSPAEMLEWLQQQANILNAIKTLQPQSLEIQRLEQLIAQHREQLISCWDRMGKPSNSHQEYSLKQLVEQSQRCLKS